MFNPFSSLPAALLCDLAINYRSSSPLIHHAVIAKMSIYKRMRRACCFDCGRSERDCSCMSGRVRGDVDTRERAFPLSSVSVNDCSTSFRACKFNPHTQFGVCAVCGIIPVLCRALWFCQSVQLMSPSPCDLVCGDMSPQLPVSLCMCLPCRLLTRASWDSMWDCDIAVW